MSIPANKLTLSIAGIQITIICPVSDWLDDLRQRYQLFAGGQTSGFTLIIQLCTHVWPDPNIPDEVSFDGHIATLRSPVYHGFIDLARGAAELCARDTHPIDNIDYFLRVTYALLVFQAGGILFHGAGILHQGNGYLFFGHSGSGKTTVSRLSVGDQVLNDDLVVLLPPASLSAVEIKPPPGLDSMKWSIHATPFWNPSQVKPNRSSINLCAMFHLVQDKHVYLEPLKKSQALAELVACVPIIPLHIAMGLRLIERTTILQKDIPVYNMHFLPEASFWRIIEALHSHPSESLL